MTSHLRLLSCADAGFFIDKTQHPRTGDEEPENRDDRRVAVAGEHHARGEDQRTEHRGKALGDRKESEKLRGAVGRDHA